MVEQGVTRMLITAIKSKPSILNLSNKNLELLPEEIGRINSLTSLDLKNNRIYDLPEQLSCLEKLKSLNIGNNKLSKIPLVLGKIQSLQTLHLFNNNIEEVHGDALVTLTNIIILNLNNNRIKEIPAEINKLSCLQYLSLDDNQLKSFPIELCHLSKLEELNLNDNLIECLPSEIAFMRSLIRLRMRKNLLNSLPEGISQCINLEILDVAGNNIQLFDSEICKMRLRELHCEGNNLIRHLPVRSVQDEEVLTLKEIVARMVLIKIDDPSSNLRNVINCYPDVKKMIAVASKCALCGSPFLNTWLECVQFVDSKKMMKTRNNAGIIPIKALLCSYKCFNKDGHNFIGVIKANV